MTKTWQTVVVSVAVLGVSGVAAAQGLQLSRVMRDKLQHAQKILETVVTSDWNGLETHTRELERLTNDPRWMVLRFPEYAKHSAAFVGALRDLRRVAGERDLERATEAYTALILRCVDCHQYVARARIAR
jgi:hypothetical protein